MVRSRGKVWLMRERVRGGGGWMEGRWTVPISIDMEGTRTSPTRQSIHPINRQEQQHHIGRIN